MNHNSFEELRMTGELPSPSGVGMQILKLTQGDDFSTEEIGQAISADSALTGRLLKLANSAESGSVEPITTIGEATIRLGIRTVRNVALGLSLVSANRSGSCDAFDYDRYWSLSLARAVAGQRLSRALRIGVPAEMYILGLLCGIGSLAFASVHPDHYTELLTDPDIATAEGLARAEVERFEINHGEVAACMLSEWGLPEEFGIAAREYEGVALSSSEDTLELLPELLAVANLIAQMAGPAPRSGRSCSPPTAGSPRAAEWRTRPSTACATRSGPSGANGGRFSESRHRVQSTSQDSTR